MTVRQGRYSFFLRPISYFIDLAVIIIFAWQFGFKFENYLSYIIFVTVGWLFLSFNSSFYETDRFTKVTHIISHGFLQFVFFTLIVLSFFGVFQNLALPLNLILKYIGEVFIVVI